MNATTSATRVIALAAVCPAPLLGAPATASAQEGETPAPVVLHLEHPITDLQTWVGNFEANAGARRQAGVRSERVWQPVGDPKYIIVDLGFDSVPAAESFRTYLEQRVWSSPMTSPALAGTPKTVILTAVPRPAG